MFHIEKSSDFEAKTYLSKIKTAPLGTAQALVTLLFFIFVV